MHTGLGLAISTLAWPHVHAGLGPYTCAHWPGSGHMSTQARVWPQVHTGLGWTHVHTGLGKNTCAHWPGSGHMYTLALATSAHWIGCGHMCTLALVKTHVHTCL